MGLPEYYISILLIVSDIYQPLICVSVPSNLCVCTNLQLVCLYQPPPCVSVSTSSLCVYCLYQPPNCVSVLISNLCVCINLQLVCLYPPSTCVSVPNSHPPSAFVFMPIVYSCIDTDLTYQTDLPFRFSSTSHIFST